MKRKLGVAIGIAALCAGGAFSMTGTASAAESGTQATYFVLYEDDNYGGRYANFSGSDVELNNKYWSGSTSAFAQNGGSSMRNNTGYSIGLWDVGTSCSGASYSVQPNSVDADFSNNSFDNKASCVKFL